MPETLEPPAITGLRLAAALQPGGVLTLERLAPPEREQGNLPESTRKPAGKSQAPLEALEQTLETAFAEDRALFLLRLGLSDPSLALHPSLKFWRGFAAAFPRKLLLLPDVETLRERARAPLPLAEMQDILDKVPPMSGAEYLHAGVLSELWQDLHRLYGEGLADFKGSVEDWFNSFPGTHREMGRIHFHLVENKQGPLPFAFLATYGSHLGKQGRVRHQPLRHALEEFRGDARKQLEALKSIHLAAESSPWLKSLLDSGEIFHPLAWTPTQAHRFLKDVGAFSEAGILCRIPDWWKVARPALQFRISLGETSQGGLGLDTLLDFRPEFTLDGEPLDEAEARRLAEAGEELALLKGRWVAVDAERIQRNLELFRKARTLAKGKSLTLAEALRVLAGASGENPLGLSLGPDEEAVDIEPGAWLRGLQEKMRDPTLVREVRPGPGFHGILRPYQQTGLNWLRFLHSLGFGGCLADDMGLGKTVQVLAFLESLREKPAAVAPLHVLLVAPASLLHNWSAEFARFAPGLRVEVAHPAWEKSGKSPTHKVTDVVLTTYGMVGRLDSIRNRPWNLVILDEAQAIKNSGSRQSRAVKSLKASHRLALTGTPVENHLFDLWSLFDFLNPGLLGSAEAFRKRASRLQEDPDAFGRLRRVIQPYILRRLKTDKALLPDLPDKVERKVRAALTRKQALLYKRLAEKAKDSLDDASGMQRRGRILALLIQFKQICNHPDHFLGAGKFREEDSGKFALLREICEPILEKHERVLVFTQFAEMADPLSKFLAGVFGRDGLVLTGSTAIRKRQALVEEFQGDAYVPFMVLSLKAGGTGLNLTRANHVVHFDRWWNPAVENQATDRVFRIGQSKNVMVHKFVTGGTLEEKIDAMIDSKAALARDILTSGKEDWITEMTDGQIVELFTLEAGEEAEDGLE